MVTKISDLKPNVVVVPIYDEHGNLKGWAAGGQFIPASQASSSEEAKQIVSHEIKQNIEHYAEKERKAKRITATIKHEKPKHEKTTLEIGEFTDASGQPYSGVKKSEKDVPIDVSHSIASPSLAKQEFQSAVKKAEEEKEIQDAIKSGVGTINGVPFKVKEFKKDKKTGMYVIKGEINVDGKRLNVYQSWSPKWKNKEPITWIEDSKTGKRILGNLLASDKNIHSFKHEFLRATDFSDLFGAREFGVTAVAKLKELFAKTKQQKAKIRKQYEKVIRKLNTERGLRTLVHDIWGNEALDIAKAGATVGGLTLLGGIGAVSEAAGTAMEVGSAGLGGLTVAENLPKAMKGSLEAQGNVLVGGLMLAAPIISRVGVKIGRSIRGIEEAEIVPEEMDMNLYKKRMNKGDYVRLGRIKIKGRINEEPVDVDAYLTQRKIGNDLVTEIEIPEQRKALPSGKVVKISRQRIRTTTTQGDEILNEIVKANKGSKIKVSQVVTSKRTVGVAFGKEEVPFLSAGKEESVIKTLELPDRTFTEIASEQGGVKSTASSQEVVQKIKNMKTVSGEDKTFGAGKVQVIKNFLEEQKPVSFRFKEVEKPESIFDLDLRDLFEERPKSEVKKIVKSKSELLKEKINKLKGKIAMSKSKSVAIKNNALRVGDVLNDIVKSLEKTSKDIFETSLENPKTRAIVKTQEKMSSIETATDVLDAVDRLFETEIKGSIDTANLGRIVFPFTVLPRKSVIGLERKKRLMLKKHEVIKIKEKTKLLRKQKEKLKHKQELFSDVDKMFKNMNKEFEALSLGVFSITSTATKTSTETQTKQIPQLKTVEQAPKPPNSENGKNGKVKGGGIPEMPIPKLALNLPDFGGTEKMFIGAGVIKRHFASVDVLMEDLFGGRTARIQVKKKANKKRKSKAGERVKRINPLDIF